MLGCFFFFLRMTGYIYSILLLSSPLHTTPVMGRHKTNTGRGSHATECLAGVPGDDMVINNKGRLRNVKEQTEGTAIKCSIEAHSGGSGGGWS